MTAKQTRRYLLVAMAYIAFISLGLPDGLLGVAWPSIRASFSLALDGLGAILLATTAGYLLSSFSSGQLVTRLGVGNLLTLSCLATATSLLGIALSSGWWAMVALGIPLGLGAGAIDAGLNVYVSTHFSTRTLNWLHAFFGIGATLGPLIMTAVLHAGLPWQTGYAIVGAAQLALALAFGATRSLWQSPTAQQQASEAGPPASTAGTLRLGKTWGGIMLFFVYAGLEVAAGQWSFSLFTLERSIEPAIAGIWISIYWGSLTLGRIIAGAIVNLISVRQLLRLCMCGSIVGAILLWINLSPWPSFLGLALMGLSFAPIFPSLIATTEERVGARHAPNAVGFQVAAAVLGVAVLPGSLGLLADRLSLEIVGPFLCVGGVVLLCLYEGLSARRQGSRQRVAWERSAED